MNEDVIVHFVLFETILDSDQFISKWQEYTRSVKNNRHVTMHQAVKENGFSYIVQHRQSPGGIQFVFEKARRSSRIRQVEIITRLAGGYSILQAEKNDDCDEDESKVFAFIIEPTADLEVYKQLSEKGPLNIYQAYYENCRYAYVLEFFVKNENAAEFLESLKQHKTTDTGIYKECVMQLS